jgi:hypothetical protein
MIVNLDNIMIIEIIDKQGIIAGLEIIVIILEIIDNKDNKEIMESPNVITVMDMVILLDNVPNVFS